MEQKSKQKTLHKIIAVLLCLLVIVVAVFVGTAIYRNSTSEQKTEVEIANNRIGSKNRTAGNRAEYDNTYANIAEIKMKGIAFGADSSARSLSTAGTSSSRTEILLYKNHNTDNSSFQVSNMFPGDIVTKDYCLKAYHNKDIDLYFQMTVRDESLSMGDILNIKVVNTDTGNVLVNTHMNAAHEVEFTELLPADPSNETIHNYNVEVIMPTSAGNEYQNSAIKCDLRWYVRAADDEPSSEPIESQPTEPSSEPVESEPSEPASEPSESRPVQSQPTESVPQDTPSDTPSKPGGEYTPSYGDDSGLLPLPQTGDMFNIFLWIIVAIASLLLALVVLLIILRGRKGGK